VTDEHYLGDGLYASYDGYQIQLRAPRELSLDDSMVYLDPGVLINFFKYVERTLDIEITLGKRGDA